VAIRAPSQRVSWLTANLVTFGSYLASGWLGLLWLGRLAGSLAGAQASTAVAVPWLAPGFATACLFVFGARAWPAVFLGSMALWAGILGSQVWLTIVESAGEAVSVVAVVAMLRACEFRPTLERYRDSLCLLAALAIGRTITTAIDAGSVVATAWLAPSPHSIELLKAAGAVRSGDTLIITAGLFQFAGRWWANTFAGCVLVMPLLALLGAAHGPRRSMLERTLLGAAVLLWLGCALALPADAPRTLFLIAALILVVWAAERFGVGIAGTITLLLVMSAAAGFGFELGVFAGGASREPLEATWGFLGLLSTAGLFLSALLSQRRRARREAAASADRYRRLFDVNPFPMWAEDVRSGRLRLANPATQDVYGYTIAEFLALPSDALRVEPAEPVPAPRLLESGATVTTERHRVASGGHIDVEVTRALIDYDGETLKACFVEPLAARNAMRLAVLNANDLERFRLGQAIRLELMSHLTSVVAIAEQCASRAGTDETGALAIAAIRDHVGAVSAIFRRLTRGASPLAYAEGDLVDALERLPGSLPAGAPPAWVSIRGSLPPSLSVERREHIYRLAEDAVHCVVAAPGARAVRLNLDATASGVTLSIEADGSAMGIDELTRHSLAVRALAAQGQLSIHSDAARGPLIRFECDAEPSRPGPPPTAAGSFAAALAPSAEHSTPAAPKRRAEAATTAPHAYQSREWMIRVGLLALAYFAAGALALEFLSQVDARGRFAQLAHWLPWIASGVAVAGLLAWGEEVWPAIAIGYVALWWGFAHSGWLGTLLGALARTAAFLVTVRLWRRFGASHGVDNPRGIAILAGAAAIGLLIAIPTDVLELIFTDPRTVPVTTPEIRYAVASSSMTILHIAAPKLYAAARWWINSLIGIVLFVPAVLAWSRAQLANMRLRLTELGAWCALLAAVAGSLLHVSDAAWRLPILGLGLASVTWAAVRFGAGLAYLATLLISLLATVGFGLGVGPLGTEPWAGPGVLWAFVILLATTAHLLTTLLADSARIEQELKQLEERYRALFEAVPHALFIYHARTGRIRLANRAALLRFGYTAGDLVSMSIADLDVAGSLPRLTKDDRRESPCSTRYRAKDGATVDVELTLAPIELDDGEGVLCAAIDVSEQNLLYTRMIEATDRERRTIAGELHDELGQVLTGLLLGAGPLSEAVRRGRAVDTSSLDFVVMASREALRAAERVLKGVSPLQESGGDLLSAVRGMPARLPPQSRDRLEVSVAATSPVRLPLALREHLLRIAQEAVTNALKHAAAQRIRVELEVRDAEIELTISDDGIGFDPDRRRRGGVGLDSLELRAIALGGTLKLSSSPGRGTTVRCRCPQLEEAGSPALARAAEPVVEA